MKVSIIIINYNTFQLTCDCIKSVLHKTQDLSYEIILVDNASVERNANDFLIQFPEIRLIKSEINLGFAKGNNLGIEHANGEYVLLLNSDTELINNAIKIALDTLSIQKTKGVISGQLTYPNGAIQHNCQRFPSWKVNLLEIFRVQKIVPKWGRRQLLGSFFSHQVFIEPDWVWGTFFMFAKELLNELPEKKLADTFFMYGEDMQWCKELKGKGFNVYFEPKAKILHHLGGSSANAKVMIEKNTKMIYTKYYSKLSVILMTWSRKLLEFTTK